MTDNHKPGNAGVYDTGAGDDKAQHLRNGDATRRHFNIAIECEGAAFENQFDKDCALEREVDRIVTGAALRISDLGADAQQPISGPLTDLNGNSVGRWAFTAEDQTALLAAALDHCISWMTLSVYGHLATQLGETAAYQATLSSAREALQKYRNRA